jgi:hypothetical protein
MASKRNSYGLAQLSADAAPRLDLSGRSTNAFNLIIGDTYADRILYWNSRSRDRAFLGRECTGLIVSPSRLDDADFFAALVAFLRERNGVPTDHGTPWVQLRTSSLSIEALDGIRDRFAAADKWNGYDVAGPISIDAAVPTKEVFEHAYPLIAGGVFERVPSFKEFPAVGELANPPLVIPRHLEGLTGNYATEGAWALDLEIERQENFSRYSNVRHSWNLPRRLRMHGAFAKPYERRGLSRHYCIPRSTLDGLLVLYGALGEELPAISLPTDEVAFRHAFQRGDSWPPFRPLEKWENPSGPYDWAQPSDKGRYLIGALRLFGGLRHAASVLGHRYWRSVFEDLGGAIGDTRRDQIKETVKKKVRTVDAAPPNWTDEVWDRITGIVASEAHKVRTPQRSLTMTELRERHRPFLEAEKEKLEREKSENAQEWLDEASSSLPRSIRGQCTRKVLFQGYKWRCDNCFNNNWNDISALRPNLTCAICGETEAAPVEDPWSFALNGFLQEAMREHGLLALVWCLVRLEARSRSTFFYLGPHELWQQYPRDERTRPDNEADLICVVDGKVHLCEVKSSPRDIDLTSTIEVAQRLRPDVVTLAVFAPPSPRLHQRIEKLRDALKDLEIEIDLLTWHPDERDEDAYLP